MSDLVSYRRLAKSSAFFPEGMFGLVSMISVGQSNRFWSRVASISVSIREPGWLPAPLAGSYKTLKIPTKTEP